VFKGQYKAFNTEFTESTSCGSSHRGPQRKPSIPSPKLLRSLLLGIKVYFYPGMQNLTADFGEIPLPWERTDEGITRIIALYFT